MSKILVAYFSLAGDNYSVGVVKEGNTRIMAKHISDYLKCDEYEIKGNNQYPEDYHGRTVQAKEELKKKLRPELVNKKKMKKYLIAKQGIMVLNVINAVKKILQVSDSNVQYVIIIIYVKSAKKIIIMKIFMNMILLK